MRFGATMRRGAGAMMDPAETTRSECAEAWDTQSLPASRRLQAGRTGWRTRVPPTAAACARGAPANTRHSLRRGAACKPTPTCSVSARSDPAEARRGEGCRRPVSRSMASSTLQPRLAVGHPFGTISMTYIEVAELNRSRFSPSRVLHVAQSGRTCSGGLKVARQTR